MYLDIGPAVIVLAASLLPEALSKAMVRLEKSGGSWRLGPVGGEWDKRGASSDAPAAVIESCAKR